MLYFFLQACILQENQFLINVPPLFKFILFQTENYYPLISKGINSLKKIVSITIALVTFSNEFKIFKKILAFLEKILYINM